ncbi:hypothetical protein SAMN05444143_101378 [Flavobacterium succinicans]|jgi:uncharacterized protein YcfL|uniref:Lipoprotein n=1 Tax=Flavobacterium succinicans TaxID=29536 RepID=A0A1I4RI78_9FLAO|nr:MULTISPECIES: hypothetical protein [Flavobacterium]SFM51959.1 hypothetical protein SAMN05444143_101378 [Flavobacterium succinicans]
MKKIYCIIVALFMLMGCTDQGDKITYDYSILNTSGKKIVLIPYIGGVKEVQNAITLQQNEKFNKKYIYYPPGAKGYNMSNLFSKTAIGSLTHVEIIFDDIKKVIYQECTTTNQCFNQARNIFNPVFSDEQTEVYTITPEDYQNAQDCGGNCN